MSQPNTALHIAIKLSFRLRLPVRTLTCGNAEPCFSLVSSSTGSVDEQSLRFVKRDFFDVCGSLSDSIQSLLLCQSALCRSLFLSLPDLSRLSFLFFFLAQSFGTVVVHIWNKMNDTRK